MNPDVIKALLPLFYELFLDLYKSNGEQVPTLEEMRNKLDNDLTRFIMQGDKWLAEHPLNESSNDSLKNTGSNT